MESNELKKQKAEIRKYLKQIRGTISKSERQIYSQVITQKICGLDEIKAAQYIFIYISFANEVDTHELINSLLEQGKILAVPKIINSKYMIAVPFTSWNDLEAGQLGILTSKSSKPLTVDFDVAITPGLGFTMTGHRIGYGRGYYDKWFAEYVVQHKVALAFEKQLIDELPVNKLDISVNKIVTENKIILI